MNSNRVSEDDPSSNGKPIAGKPIAAESSNGISSNGKAVVSLPDITVRFCGDSGDGNTIKGLKNYSR